jgi:hypothetical protein
MFKLTTMREIRDLSNHKVGEYIVYGSGYSSHPTNIVSTYIPNSTGGAIYVSFYKNKFGQGSEIYFYRNWKWGEHFYKSRHYKNCKNMPTKYKEVIEALKEKYNEIFSQ